MDFSIDALFGGGANTSQIPATMLNPGAAGGARDWGAILADGIVGATNGAIGALVKEKFDSGQLVATQTAAAQQQKQLMPLIVIGGIAYLLMKA